MPHCIEYTEIDRKQTTLSYSGESRIKGEDLAIRVSVLCFYAIEVKLNIL